MTRKQAKQICQEGKTRLAIQKEIVDKFGDSALLKARERLCFKCTKSPCFLLPLTTNGTDCPYFARKGA